MAAVTIEDFAYKGPGRVSPGDKIDVTNEDSSSHTLTSDQAGEFDVTVEADGAADFAAPAKPGTYPYHCTFHGDMSGTLVVG
jgi:plastocyanin